ncbi:1-phosphofructokinase [Halalkalicoccus subterraneus]|uniref:1-phosphofructokinase n=1 Tax=Halalkalicoccus subterraneus TaxID=2675002 RepID=UPI000EFCE389|nr:1-phosphofructokinase [Halalkalicoccus subterraneus]
MIVTVTPNPAVDYTVSLTDEPTAGTVTRTDRTRYDAGGKGINVSKYLASLDTDTLATGFLGGFVGEYLETQLETAELPAEFVAIDGTTRLNTTLLTPDAEYKINQTGPTVDEGAVDALVSRLRERDPNTVVIAGSLPPGIDTATVDRIAAAGEWETAIDLNGDVLGELSGEYVLCKPNRKELAAATGTTVDSVENAIEAAHVLRKRGFERVVASLGADGAVLVSDERALYAPALDVEVVDTVGAGDAMLSGVLSALDRGEGERAALGTGIAVSSRVVALPGTSVPSLANIDTTRDTVAVERR